jgi:hypothetical protein
MSGLKWTRRTTRKIARALTRTGIPVSAGTVARLLKQMDFSLRVNVKRIESGIKNPPSRRHRNRQFLYIAQQRERMTRKGNPIVSVDSKKRELIGQFKNPGRCWVREPIPVNDHDFLTDAVGIALPYSLYDTQRNEGAVCVGTSHDTPAFAADAVASWWQRWGCHQYPQATELLILADAGGSNSCRSRVWKWQLQTQFANRFRLPVTVCHYPPGASKWNPVEHRLLSEISKNWQGKPLDSYATTLNYIRRTQTTTGLRVHAYLARKLYENGQRITDLDFGKITLRQHTTQPQWNYTLTPNKM